MNRHELNVHNLPRDVAEAELAGSVVVVIDLLRATSTICQAIALGASEVIPCLEIEDALAAADAAGRSNVVLGGERKGGKIPGFDLGNSPSEYTPEAVRGRKVIITTTNGTRALHHARLARRILVGAFMNLSAVIASIEDERRVDILCAGTDGGSTREDILAAGAVADGLARASDGRWQMSGAATLARNEWLAVVKNAQAAGRPINEQLAIELRDTQGGRNLLGINLGHDLVDCAQIDRLNVVPELDVAKWRITA
jgi:2-phosphosulfolactate phosphatase